MVGRNNHQKTLQANLKKHYKTYKAGRHWVFASIASLSMGAVLFFSAGLTTFAKTDSSAVDTTSTSTDSTSGTSTASSSVVLSSSTANSGSVDDQSGQDTSDSQSNTAETESDTESTVAQSATQSKATESNQANATKAVVNTKESNASTTNETATTVEDAGTSAQTDTNSTETKAAQITDSDSDTVASDVDNVKVTKLVAPTADKISAAKTAAAAVYATTGQAQKLEFVAGEPTTADKLVITSEVSSLGHGTTPLNGSGGATDYTITVKYSNVKAGDVITYTLPTNLDLLKYVENSTLVNGVGTTTVTPNADGTTTITDTFTADASGINIQTSKLSSYNNNADLNMSADQVGQSVTGQITSTYNGVADDSYTITQYYDPTVAIPTSPTRSNPTSTGTNAVKSVLPNTDYVYSFALSESPDYINVTSEGWAAPSQQVRRTMNTGGTTITIPVPSSFVLNSDLTNQLNGFTSSTTTITQTGEGADIIITVPANTGVSGNNLNPYYLAGSYDIEQTSAQQTLTAAGGATISQIAPNGTLTATTADGSKWTETIAAVDEPDTTTTGAISGGGNSNTANPTKLMLNAGPDSPKYINSFSVDTNSAYVITDAKITINVPDGVDGTGFTVPATNSNLNKGAYTTGTTEYGYTVTHADGTVETGTVKAGGTFNSTSSSPIRTIVLTPNYLAPGSGKFEFNLIGTLSNNYDDGTAVAVGDNIVFNESVDFPSNETDKAPFTGKNTETVADPVADARAYLQTYNSQTTPGQGHDSYIANYSGNFGQTTNYIYEPILYFVLPTYGSVKKIKIPATDLAAGVQVSYYTTDSGATGVKIDYTGTGLYMNEGAGTGTYGVALNDSPIDTVAGTYPSYFLIYSPVTTLQGTSPNTDLSLADGDSRAVLATNGERDWTIKTVSSTNAFNFAQGNQDTDAVSAGTSDVSGSSTMDFYANMVNSLSTATSNTSEILNLPTIGDEAGSTYTFNLTGPITLPTNFTNAAGNGAAITDAQVLYGLSTYDSSSTSTTPDTTSFMTEDELLASGHSWSDVRSVYISVGSIPVNTSTGRIQIEGTVDNLIEDAGKIGYLGSLYYANNANPSVSQKAASIAVTGVSTVKAQFHYVDDSGQDVYIPLADLSKTYNDNVDTMNTTDFPSTATDFNADDTALIPSKYVLATNSDGSLIMSIKNSDVSDYDGHPNELAAFGQVVQYYFNDDTVTYELTNGKASLTVTYVDDSNDGAIVGAPSKITNTVDTHGTYTATAPTNYLLASGQDSEIPYVLSLDDSDNITVHLVHNVTYSTVTTTQTVNYVQQTTNQVLHEPTTQTITWNVSTDAVTNDSVYTPQEGYAATSPAIIAGYTPVGTGIAQNMPAPTTTAP
ncbi:KxYKxGKxW signal peptide domain-containing protein, partial [Secundilactobacillus odoratitofui]|uniref:KxYKxGKxW signal peptide domain-containing protein n=2 Tax=Secundilactobacillus odoratitofui TaxID=480930 RepID=UPI000A81B185